MFVVLFIVATDLFKDFAIDFCLSGFSFVNQQFHFRSIWNIFRVFILKSKWSTGWRALSFLLIMFAYFPPRNIQDVRLKTFFNYGIRFLLKKLKNSFLQSTACLHAPFWKKNICLFLIPYHSSKNVCRCTKL